MTARLTKSKLLREARRVYGDVLSLNEQRFFLSAGRPKPERYVCSVITGGGRYSVSVSGRSLSEARRMAMAALQAAGGGR